MPHCCAAYGCSNRSNGETKSRGITFHGFPKKSDLRRLWERAVKRKGFTATKSTKLCSDHFKAEDFDRTGQTVRLRHEVVPSVFNFPPHLQKKVLPRTTKTSKKAEESLPVDLPQQMPIPKLNPTMDHNYALPSSPNAIKARLNEALARVRSLEHKNRNSMIRERRVKKNVLALLNELSENDLIDEELKDRLHSIWHLKPSLRPNKISH